MALPCNTVISDILLLLCKTDKRIPSLARKGVFIEKTLAFGQHHAYFSGPGLSEGGAAASGQDRGTDGGAGALTAGSGHGHDKCDLLQQLCSRHSAGGSVEGLMAAPHNCVCGSQRIFCTSSAVPKTGNTYSIPAFSEL